MSIQWGPLLAVFVVSLVSTVGVVLLITLALLGWSARAARVGPVDPPTRSALFTRTEGTAVAATCLVAASVIVLLALWVIAVR
jgi:hypothetical protein